MYGNLSEYTLCNLSFKPPVHPRLREGAIAPRYGAPAATAAPLEKCGIVSPFLWQNPENPG